MEAKVETLRNQRRKKFMTRGITFAVASGICYGLYTGFLTLSLIHISQRSRTSEAPLDKPPSSRWRQRAAPRSQAQETQASP